MAIICYVCNEKAHSWRQNFATLKLQHSKIAIFVALRHLLKDFQSVRNADDAANAICGDCFSDLEHYDLMQVQVAQMQKKLRTVLLRTEAFHIQEAKRQNEQTAAVKMVSDEPKDMKTEDFHVIKVKCILKEESHNQEANEGEGSQLYGGKVDIKQEDVGQNVENVSNCIKDEPIASGEEDNGIEKRNEGDKKPPSNATDDCDLDQIASGSGAIKPEINQPSRKGKAIEPFSERMHLCRICTDGLEYDIIDLQRHTLMQHMKIDIATCGKCNSLSENPSKLMNHFRWHKKHPDKTINPGYICTICRYRSNNKEAFIKHNELHKKVPKNFCVICNKSFESSTFRKHVRTHKARTAMCDICGKVVSRNCLIQHKTTHIEETPVQCELCPKSFKNRGYLYNHKATVHSQDRPFACSFCDMKFKRKDHCRKHELRHQQDTKTLKCPVDDCNSAFEHNFHLNQHIERKHGGQRLKGRLGA